MAIKRWTLTASIANGAATSSAIPMRGRTAAVVLPAAFTGASISFTVCDTRDGTYQALYDIENALVDVTVVQGRSYDLPQELVNWPWFKIVSASAEGGARSLTIVEAD